ncbi:ArsC/Spx/MgsR family protein [Furfurilactobacillus sp. WILCCON 0119]|uniref:ArsC/Spx/MgsR family protein n=1 Tax=Furfurilactobacillus entadae TaxID=2922307 RepID=UPI0035EDA869
MISLYTIPSNFPSRRAVTWFKDHHITVKEYRVHPSAPTLVKLPLKSFLAASENGVDDLLALKSKAMVRFKQTHSIDDISLNDLLTTIAENPSMLHFPIIFDSDRSIVQFGFSEDDIRTFIPHAVRHDSLLQLLEPLNSSNHQHTTAKSV